MPDDLTSGEPSIRQILGELDLTDGGSYLDMLRWMSRLPGDDVAIEFNDQSVTYEQLLSMVAGAVSHLEDRGIRRGSHVAYLCQPHPDAVAAYLALLGMGAVLVPIYHELDGAALAGLLARLNVDSVVADAPFVGRFDRPPSAAPLRMFPRGGGEFVSAIHAGGDVSALVGRAAPASTEPAPIMSSSGTTGEPKGIVQPHAFCTAGYVVLRKWRVDVIPRAYVCTAWGQGVMQWIVPLTLWRGGTLVLAERFSASRMWDEVRRHRCNYVQVVGTMPQMLLNQPARDNDREHEIEVFVSTGMPATQTVAFQERFGVTVREQYGATDGGGVVFLSNPGIYPAGSVGRPWQETEARIVDSNGVVVSDGEVGELQMRPREGLPSVTYYNDPEAGAAKTAGGWISTGDFLTRDVDGNYWFVDRQRDVIRRRGINIAPAVVEGALSGFPGVGHVAAFAVPSPLGEDEIKVTVAAALGTVRPEELDAFARDSLPAYMRPHYIEVVEQMPMTSATHKVQRYKLRENWSNTNTWDCARGAFIVDVGAPTV